MGLLDKLLAKLKEEVLDSGKKTGPPAPPPRPRETKAPAPPSGATPLEVYRHHLEQLLAAGDQAEFATFTDATVPDRWVQVLFQDTEPRAQLNLQYPYREDPTTHLAARGATLPDGCEVAEWEAEHTAMISCRSAVPSEIASVLDAIYRAVHGIEGEYSMRGEVE